MWTSPSLSKGELLFRAKEEKMPFIDRLQLPSNLQVEHTLTFDPSVYNLYFAFVDMLRRHQNKGICSFRDEEESSKVLETCIVHKPVFSNFSARQELYQCVAADRAFLAIYERLVQDVILPAIALEAGNKKKCVFWYQYPPSVRLQPGPCPDAFTRAHRDAEYGHQPGEINFWLPLTSHDMTQTSLWVESAPGVGDFHPLPLPYGQVAWFYGCLCYHYAPPNLSPFCRVSLDFRIGVEGYFDPTWKLEGVKRQHSWKMYEYV
eukprot:PhF_6_TR17407/c0_g1_i1/m.26646